ncbi:MAG: hypothetical protein LBI03_06205, partial [Clostridiales bacterium]|nr:hypothetical protein [Clostridiales bacterium]
MRKINKNIFEHNLEEEEYKTKHVAVGFDGFVDLLVKPVRQIHNGERQYFTTIGEFGEYLTQKASLSCSLELTKLSEQAGGNMPLFAHALSALGVKTDCIGSMGYPDPLDVFCHLGENVSITSVAGAGSCTSLEFNDGKVMLATNGDLNQLDFAMLKGCVGLEQLKVWLGCSNGAAFLNWSELPGCTSIWRGLLKHVLPSIGLKEEKWLLIDISDCSRRSSEEIKDMISLINDFGRYYQVVFSMNLNEYRVLCGALGLSCGAPVDTADALCAVSDADIVVVHMLDGAVCTDAFNSMFVPS